MQQFEGILQNYQKNTFCAKFFNVLKDKEYLYNEPFLKEYIAEDGQKKYKLTIMRCVKNKLVESPSFEKIKHNDFKLENNVSRARDIIYQLAYCNKWDYFFTGTLDKTKHNREDIKEFKKAFKIFVSNFNRKYNCKIKFLLIPELHSDLVSWHFHGFLANIPCNSLAKFKIGDKMGSKIAEKVSLGVDVFHLIDWDNKFGFNDLEFIQNKDAISCYITKYVTKGLLLSVKTLNAHTYYCSKGLKRANDISAKKIDLSLLPKLKPAFSNDYCSLYWLSENDLKSISLNNL